MNRVKQWNPRIFKKVLRDNGYELVRTKGSHSIWENNNGNSISVPMTKINCMLARRLIKENNLILN